MDDQILEALFAVVLLSFVVERALAVVFELPYVDREIHVVPNPDDPARPRSIKGYIAAAVSIAICMAAGLNLPDAIFRTAGDAASDADALSGSLGAILTGLVVAGGSQASVKLFQDVLGVSRERRDHVKRLQEEQIAADMAEAENRLKQATYGGGGITPGPHSLLANDRFARAMRRAGEADARRRIDAAEGRVNVDEEKRRSAAHLRERLRANRKAREATLRRR